MMDSKTLVILLWVNLHTLDLLQLINAVEEKNLKNGDGIEKIKTSNGESVHNESATDDSKKSNSLGYNEGGSSSQSANGEHGKFKFKLEKIICTSDGEEDILIIWKIENGLLRPTDLKDYRAFKSDETYVVVHIRRDLVLMQKSQAEDAFLNVFSVETKRDELADLSKIYYWIGKNSALMNISGAAFHAMGIDASIHETVNLQRESEGHESSSFKAAFERNTTATLSEATVPNTVDENTKMMFLVREDYMTRFTQVNSSLKRFIFEKDICIVLNSAVVYTYCGYSASIELKKLARHVAKKLLAARSSEVKDIIIYRTEKHSSEIASEEGQRMKQFFAEFTPISETEAIFDRNLRLDDEKGKRESKWSEQEDLPIVRFYVTDKQTVMEEEIDYKNISISSFRSEECYLVDVGPNVGFFVWIGNNSDYTVRGTSARGAELLLRKRGYSHTTPILYADERKVNIPPTVYLSDLTTLMKNVKLPITWILFPDEESTAQPVPDVGKDAEFS